MPRSNAAWVGWRDDVRPTSELPGILRALRVILHVTFAVMWAIGLARFVLTTTEQLAPTTVVIILALMLAGLYIAGTVAELRFTRGVSRFDPFPLTVWWLLSILILWGGLVMSSMSFAWVSFPLLFLVLHLLDRWPAATVMVAMVSVIIVSAYLHAGGTSFDPAIVLGPTIGACVAIVVSVIYRLLVKEADRMRLAYDQLHRAQTQIALSQHEAGRLAERDELAADVHDTLAQGFTSIVVLSRTLKQHVHSPDAEATVSLIEETAQTNLTQARQFLCESPLGATSVVPAIEAACGAIEQASAALGTPITCTVEVNGDPFDAGHDVHKTLIRGTQSLLSNVALHAHATQAKVTLTYWEDCVSVDVVDNGQGFDRTYGYGLRTLAERVNGAGGTFTVESAPDDGTAVHLRLPVKATP